MKKTVWKKADGVPVMLDASDRNPISNSWLIPRSCSEEEPPALQEGERVHWEDGRWVVEEQEDQEEQEGTKGAFE